MQGLIYLVGADGELQRMKPSAPASEQVMQELVARHPEVISGGNGDLLLIRREAIWLYGRPSMSDEAVRQRLLDDLAEIVGPMTTRNLRGFPSFKVSLLAAPEIAERMEAWLSAAVREMR